MRAATAVLLIVSPVNLALNILFVHYTPLGLLGSPAAISVTYWLSFFLLALAAVLSPTHRQNGTWGGIQIREVLQLQGLIMFIQLALPGILMVGTEW